MMRKRTFLGALGAGLAGAVASRTGAQGLLDVADPPGARGEILWDSYGVPHVYGRDEAAVFYGFGWAQAQNHGDIVLHLYGEARGRAAEYWGEKFTPHLDRWVLVQRYPRARGAIAGITPPPPSSGSDLDAFAQGINDYARRQPRARSRP